jgi:hypothetical protein
MSVIAAPQNRTRRTGSRVSMAAETRETWLTGT